MKPLQLHKKRFGKLTAYHRLSFSSNRELALWYCVCDCGGIKIAESRELNRGRVKSCGCLRHRKGRDSQGWKGGKIKTICAWCGKVKYKHPCFTYKNNFCDHCCHGKWLAVNFSGKNNPQWKKIKTKCAWCGKELYRVPSQLNANSFCNYNHQGEWESINKSGANSHQWKGGISCEPYCETWNDKEFKNYILARDNFKCQNPDCWGTNKKLCRHHIDYNKKNCNPNNVITICISCNGRANANRERHTEYYKEIMKERRA